MSIRHITVLWRITIAAVLSFSLVIAPMTTMAISIEGQVNQAIQNKDDSVIKTLAVVPNVIKRIDAGGSTPADPNMAVGPEVALALVNSAVVILDKETGERIAKYNELDFFDIPFVSLDGGSAGDPIIYFDEYSQRFVALIWEQIDSGANSQITIESPAAIAGTYPASKGVNAGSQAPFDLQGLEIGLADPLNADVPLSNDLTGKLGLVSADGFNVPSSVKGDNVAKAGGVGMILFYDGEELGSIFGSNIVPSVSTANSIGQMIIANLPVVAGIKSLDQTEIGGEGYAIMHIAISKDATPRSKDDFYTYHVGDKNGPWNNGDLADYPKLGVDKDALYIATNSYILPVNVDGKVALYSHVVALEKSPLVNGTGPVKVVMNDRKLSDPALDFEAFGNSEALIRIPTVVRPNVSDSTQAMYLINPVLDYPTSETEPASGASVLISVVTNILGKRPKINEIEVPVERWFAPNGGGGFNGAPQPADVFGLFGGARLKAEVIPAWFMYRCVAHESSLWCTHSVGEHDAQEIRWYEFDISKALAKKPSITLKQQGSIVPPEGISYFFPSLDVDKDGNMAIGFDLAGYNQPLAVGYTGRLATDPMGEIRPVKIVFETHKNFPYLDFSVNENLAVRWGDYTSMTVDPVDRKTFYYYTQYFEKPSANLYKYGQTEWNSGYIKFRIDAN